MRTSYFSFSIRVDDLNNVRLRLNIVDYDNEPIDIEKLKQSFKHYDDEMERLASAYADYIVNLMTLEEKRTGEKPLLFLEHTLDCSYSPDMEH